MPTNSCHSRLLMKWNKISRFRGHRQMCLCVWRSGYRIPFSINHLAVFDRNVCTEYSQSLRIFAGFWAVKLRVTAENRMQTWWTDSNQQTDAVQNVLTFYLHHGSARSHWDFCARTPDEQCQVERKKWKIKIDCRCDGMNKRRNYWQIVFIFLLYLFSFRLMRSRNSNFCRSSIWISLAWTIRRVVGDFAFGFGSDDVRMASGRSPFVFIILFFWFTLKLISKHTPAVHALPHKSKWQTMWSGSRHESTERWLCANRMKCTRKTKIINSCTCRIWGRCARLYQHCSHCHHHIRNTVIMDANKQSDRVSIMQSTYHAVCGTRRTVGVNSRREQNKPLTAMLLHHGTRRLFSSAARTMHVPFPMCSFIRRLVRSIMNVYHVNLHVTGALLYSDYVLYVRL